MDLDCRLQHVAVVGAAGKMGRGICLLLAQEMAFAALAHRDRVYVLNCVDVDDQALMGLQVYLREQAKRTGERQINRLRGLYADRQDLVENGEMIDAFVEEVLLHVRTGNALQMASQSSLVLEAIREDVDLKVGLYRQLRDICPDHAFFLSNTSSIPLHEIAEKADIGGRIIGFHFYNPPAVQKLVELITPEGCSEELVQVSQDLAKRLRKTLVAVHDVAGFVGNGHFVRDGLFAGQEVERLAGEMGMPAAMLALDVVTRDWLLRPMGIFQLLDYVGLDVFQAILATMDRHMPKQGFHSPLVDRFMAAGICGGQMVSGAQKDGIFQYEKGRPVAIYDLGKGEYVPLSTMMEGLTAWMGNHPEPKTTWRGLQRDRNRDDRLRTYFSMVTSDNSQGAALAKRFLEATRQGGLALVSAGVAASKEDVNQIMMLGFFHLYGPVHDYL